MNTDNFSADLKQKTARLQQYMKVEAPKMASAKILRFIDGNFRAQGFQGATFLPWKENARRGTILIRKGRLRRSFRSKANNDGTVRTWSISKYAKVHNNGFNGKVTVNAHQRRKYTASKIGTGKFTKTGKERQKTIHTVTGVSSVKTHTRKVRIVKRQMMPTKMNQSPVLMNSIKREVLKEIKRIFN